MLTSLVIYAILGSIAGVLAGLLGVGGGIVIVPMLSIAFTMQHFPHDVIMHLALGTSMASIIFTSISSAVAHNRREAVLWNIVKIITPSILVGTFLGSFFASKIPTQYLQLFFALFLLFVSFQMFLGKTPKASRTMPKALGVSFFGSIIGIISSLVGIGGGTLSVPFMVFHNIEMRKAIGTSSAIGIPIAVAGAAGYLVNGLSSPSLPEYSLGYIYLPALIGLVMFSTLTSPFGAKLTHTLPVSRIKKCFALLLLVISLKMLSGTI